jgi:hypothetical protein
MFSSIFYFGPQMASGVNVSPEEVASGDSGIWLAVLDKVNANFVRSEFGKFNPSEEVSECQVT